jgi:hypothetical protein
LKNLEEIKGQALAHLSPLVHKPDSRREIQNANDGDPGLR